MIKIIRLELGNPIFIWKLLSVNYRAYHTNLPQLSPLAKKKLIKRNFTYPQGIRSFWLCPVWILHFRYSVDGMVSFVWKWSQNLILKEKNASFLSLSLRAFTLNLVFALVSRKIPKDNTKGRSLHLHQGELAYQDPIASKLM